MTRFYNFSAGPATLPLPVLEEAQRYLVEYPGSGKSVMEMSHRSGEFGKIIEEVEANFRSLLHLPESFHICFLQGGASLQFSMVPMNFCCGNAKVPTYIETGSWATKAVKEAGYVGAVHTAWSGKTESFCRVPRNDELQLRADTPYVHFTSNETIEGVEFATEPESNGVPLVCDASSDIMSRPIAWERYGLLYAGAQKNLGPAGVTVVIIRDDFLQQAAEKMPAMLSYRLQVEKRSLYNTIPTFGIYLMTLVSRWLKQQGGVEVMAPRNREKAQRLYALIDGSAGFYRGHAQPESRSMMNIVWRLADESLEKAFVDEAKAAGLDGLKGHRSVGGIRASIYNAMPLEGVEALANFMEAFRATHST
jgi:phosphoserine aminotransferase